MSRMDRFLSRVLRHGPEEIGLSLDAQGWVAVDDLLKELKRAGRPLRPADLFGIVTADDKQRFTVSADGRKIRAAQGHSIAVDLGRAPVVPPEALYHSTWRGNPDSIFASGICPGHRRQAHLSADRETAELVGRHHGKSVVLSITATCMHSHGHVFYLSDNGLAHGSCTSRLSQFWRRWRLSRRIP